jgi:hypothetical protein
MLEESNESNIKMVEEYLEGSERAEMHKIEEEMERIIVL